MCGMNAQGAQWHVVKKVIVSQSNVNQIAYISTLQFGEIEGPAV